MANIQIALDNGTVFCTPDNGNCYEARNGTINWTVRDRDTVFRLSFRRERFQGVRPTASNWPFSSPAGPSNSWTDRFSGTLKDEIGAYKYSVEAAKIDDAGKVDANATYFLDPMIIIG
jgi:hypothetical protein